MNFGDELESLRDHMHRKIDAIFAYERYCRSIDNTNAIIEQINSINYVGYLFRRSHIPNLLPVRKMNRNKFIYDHMRKATDHRDTERIYNEYIYRMHE